MESKYYTPNISEFSPNFELEKRKLVVVSENNTIEQWSRFMIKDIMVGWDYNTLSKACEKGDFRVKYLDREDIESLGFIYDNNAEPIPSRQDWEIPKLDEYECPLAFMKDTQDVDGKLWIIYLYRDNTIWIEYIKDCCGMEYLFKGIIKNKSELKVLLKQLGIE
jgi:hypothetical protein